MIDLLLVDVAKLTYEERLRQAQQRYVISAVAPHPETRLVDNLLLGLSRWLIDSGEQLRQRVEMHPSVR